MILTKVPRNFARFFLLSIVLVVWQSAVFAIDRLPDRRAERTSSSSSSSNQPGSASSETVMELLQQVDSLQNEIQDLRNRSEIQSHELERLKAQQKSVLQDLDQRLGNLERGGKAKTSFSSEPVPIESTGSNTQLGVKPLAPVAKPVVSNKSKSDNKAKKEYDAAFALLKKGAYEKATKSFRSFVKRNPNHNLAGNAQYWIGKASFVMRHFKVALKELKKVPTEYPKSSKVADAELQIGNIYYEMGDKKKAKKSFDSVIKKYPDSRVAKQAKTQLSKLKGKKK